ncbi:MAG: carbohydrate binding domain-containing protein [Sphingobacteriaceae bacterium]|nr:carbohydrate binding domain-containing protein [Sphingobacteriaceae bacterium]MBK7817824.1 carbohydrate binding domain-containing protein [Sphingobacteriaceae bacterium]
MRYLILQFLALLVNTTSAQCFVNGDFENHKASRDEINLSNTAFNGMMPGVTAFGSYGDVDIIRSSDYGGSGAQSKNWYIALTGGGTDIVAIELTQPLTQGKKYTVSFYDRAASGYNANPIQLGLSTSNSTLGTPVYTFKESAVKNVWTRRECSFIAPLSGKYLTVQMPEGTIQTWVNIDNFKFGNSVCDTTRREDIVIINDLKKDSIIKQDIVEALDTATEIIAEKKFVSFNKRKCNGRKYKVQQTVNVESNIVKVQVYDKNRVDGDIISIYLNGEVLIENLEVTKEKKEIILNLKTGSNTLVMYALNAGRIPPNTAAIAVNNKGKYKISTLVSDFKTSGALELVYDPAGVAMR